MAGVAALGVATLVIATAVRRARPVGIGLLTLTIPLVYRGVTGRWPLVDPRRGGDTRAALGGARGFHVRESVRLQLPPETVYAFWRQLANLPRFMAHVDSVSERGDGRSEWVARGPAGRTVSWQAEIINDVPGERLAWRSLPGADVVSAGSVAFLPVRGGAATQVTVHLQYEPPAGQAGRLLASLFGVAPEQTVREDLRRLKQLLEAGEIATSAARPGDAPAPEGARA